MDATDSIRILLQAILLPKASKSQQITRWGCMVNQSQQTIDKDAGIGNSHVSGGAISAIKARGGSCFALAFHWRKAHCLVIMEISNSEGGICLPCLVSTLKC
jgi:hypothetical protein